MGAWFQRCGGLALWCASAGLFLLPGSSPAQARPSKPKGPSLQLELILPQNTEIFFGSVSDVELLPDGSIVVLDPMNRTIYRFRRDGSFLDSLGRAGRGPGEMEYPVDLEVGPRGEIAVADAPNGRVTFWTPQGTVASTTRLAGWPADMWWRPGGLFLKSHRIGTLSRANLVFFYRLTPGLDTLTEPIATFEFERDPNTLLTRGLSCDLCPAEVTPDGRLLLADPDPAAYRVVEARSSGQVIRVWERPGLPAVGFSEAELAQFREFYQRRGDRFDPKLFKYRLRIKAIFMDEAGRLWVLRNTPDPEPARLDVFSGDQRLLAELPVPRRMHIFAIRRGLVMARDESKDGEPVVHVYRIVE
jgi:6-bladed beta-propeller